MKIKIKCPVCRAQNEMNPQKLNCRRCQEDLSLLYTTKAYSFKYRLYLLRILKEDNILDKQKLAKSAYWLAHEKG